MDIATLKLLKVEKIEILLVSWKTQNTLFAPLYSLSILLHAKLVIHRSSAESS